MSSRGRPYQISLALLILLLPAAKGSCLDDVDLGESPNGDGGAPPSVGLGGGPSVSCPPDLPPFGATCTEEGLMCSYRAEECGIVSESFARCVNGAWDYVGDDVAIPVCVFDGQSYCIGETFSSQDGCSCSCFEGSPFETEVLCDPGCTGGNGGGPVTGTGGAPGDDGGPDTGTGGAP
ncbi:MAG: hypothetical protein AAGA56_17865 [Myxococcota bacterium]